MQLKRFCEAIKSEHGSWDAFDNVLNKESIFTIFRVLRSFKSIRLTFKNLAAMKSFVGLSNDFYWNN